MRATVVALLVAGAVLSAGRGRRGRPGRLVDLVDLVGSSTRSGGRAWRGAHDVGGFAPAALAGELGRRIRRLVGSGVCDPAADRFVGAAALALLAVPFVGLARVAFGAAVVAFAVAGRRRLWVGRRAAETRRAVRDELPDVVELVRAAVGAGLTVHLAVQVVAGRVDGPVGDALREVRRRVLLGERLTEALDTLLALGDDVRPFVLALLAAERDGAPAGPSLERAAAEARLLRRRAAEEDARRLPVQLLFPLVACILPAFGLLTVVPLLGGAMRSLRW